MPERLPEEIVDACIVGLEDHPTMPPKADRGRREPASFPTAAGNRGRVGGAMAAWRREALAAFPELHTELNDVDDIFSVYALWFTLKPMHDQALRDGDEDFLSRVYTYAEWCHRASPELDNAVVVCFYEHLVDGRHETWWARWLPRLSDPVIADVWPEWEERLTEDELGRLRKLLRDQRRALPPDPR